MRLPIGIVYCMLLFSLTACEKPKAPVLLTFTEGETRSVSLKSNTTFGVDMKAMTKAMGGMGGMAGGLPNMDTSLTEDIEFQFKVTRVDENGNAEIDAKIVSHDVDQKIPMMGMVPELENIQYVRQAVCKGLRGKEFKMHLTRVGKVSYIIGWQEIKVGILRSVNATDLDRQMPGLTKNTTDEIASEDVIKKRIESLFALYREEPIAEGDSWSVQPFSATGTPFAVKTIYTHGGNEGGYTLLGVHGEVDMTMFKDGPLAMLGGDIDFKGDSKGSAALDGTTGWIVKEELQTDILGESSMSIPGGPSLKMPMTIKGTRVVETVAM